MKIAEELKEIALALVLLVSFLFLLFMAIASAPASADTIKIAIIDTGYNKDEATFPLKLCKTGHYDYAMKREAVIPSKDLHGTNVASVIAKELIDEDYCAIIFRVTLGPSYKYELENALVRAQKEKVKAINLSIVGVQHSYLEKQLFIDATKAGIKIFTGAGNDNINLDQMCIAHPGCYGIEGVVTVGSLSPDYTQKAVYSNYGTKVNVWYPGAVRKKDGRWAEGTSYASPAALADYVLSLKKQ